MIINKINGIIISTVVLCLIVAILIGFSLAIQNEYPEGSIQHEIMGNGIKGLVNIADMPDTTLLEILSVLVVGSLVALAGFGAWYYSQIEFA